MAGADVDVKDEVRTLPCTCCTVLPCTVYMHTWGLVLANDSIYYAQLGISPLELEMTPALKQALSVSVSCVCLVSTWVDP